MPVKQTDNRAAMHADAIAALKEHGMLEMLYAMRVQLEIDHAAAVSSRRLITAEWIMRQQEALKVLIAEYCHA